MKYLYLISATFFWLNSISQNIFDQENSDVYANHLFNNKEYSEASKEYERLLDIKPCDSLYSIRFLSSYLRSGDYKSGILKYEELADKGQIDENSEVLKIYLLMLLHEDEYLKYDVFLSDKTESTDSFLYDFQLSSRIIKGEYLNATELLDSEQFISFADSSKLRVYRDLISDCEDQGQKKPFLAAALSVFIPGSGNAYSDDFRNGARAFSIISLYVWQAFRAFNYTHGKQIYVWIFGTAAVIFYAGNIYGSYKSAFQHNDLNNEKIKEKILEILYHENEF